MNRIAGCKDSTTGVTTTVKAPTAEQKASPRNAHALNMSEPGACLPGNLDPLVLEPRSITLADCGCDLLAAVGCEITIQIFPFDLIRVTLISSTTDDWCNIIELALERIDSLMILMVQV